MRGIYKGCDVEIIDVYTSEDTTDIRFLISLPDGHLKIVPSFHCSIVVE